MPSWICNLCGKSSWNSNKKCYHCKDGINPKYKTNIGISSRKQLKE